MSFGCDINFILGSLLPTIAASPLRRISSSFEILDLQAIFPCVIRHIRNMCQLARSLHPMGLKLATFNRHNAEMAVPRPKESGLE